MIKALIFDVDETLITYGVGATDKTAMWSYLRELKEKHHLFLGVASFNNTYGSSLMERHFPDLFDCIVTEEQHDYDDFNKKRMLQSVRKEYTKVIKTTRKRSSKLRWEEMIFFDDNDDVLSTLKDQCPKLHCVPVNDRTGVTIRHIERVLKEHSFISH